MIGIVTFHGSHNYGSVLQAYATQKLLDKLGYKSEIINFRMESQKDYYSLYPTKYGMRTMIGNLLLLPYHRERKSRMYKFEKFIHSRYKLSGEELTGYKDLETISSKYDIYLTGSDQIWSNRIPELVKSDTDYTGVYFLDFVDDTKKKISFASSVGESDEEDLYDKINLLKTFSSLSTRETYGVNLLSEITKRPVEKVLDPTLMLSKEEWTSIAPKDPIIKGKYILLYTLRGIRKGFAWGKALSKLSKRLNMRVICISPFFPVIYPGMKNMYDIGPEEFINLINNATLIFTDSFHGTAFSINFNKPFYSLTPGKEKDARKREIIDALELSDRIISDHGDVYEIKDWTLDYKNRNTNNKLEILRKTGVDYLIQALG